ncbi:hypothetical protein Acy02nite_68150 [Actinoplanes cyaneus]|uniref:Uncharacterized protein n=1 Tax=Actinoplanes cyaneus TaxID=52696 RepID=A0A919INK5_9ACTN|nr:hypothetical protein [Actinoplanes cyaneus]MCW2139130.1 hypothetical protein [Actinoplanes cyaneus]GID68934.1 hypothetical protein Acy02nite_68150 [Actinoplanes cyaneus]
MPHLPDDDGFEPPLKVLRKRFNGVYREDHGLSGPARRYILLVAMLVALASVPTLAVITVGTSEITGKDRPGAMDAPFLPPPVTGPVRPSTQEQSPSAYGPPGRPPSVPVQPPTATPDLSPQVRTGEPIPAVPGLPVVPDDDSPVAATSPNSPADGHPKSADEGVSRPGPVAAFPTIPGLPAVPDDDWEPPLARRAAAGEMPRFDDSAWDKMDSSDDDDSDDELDSRGGDTGVTQDDPPTAQDDPPKAEDDAASEQDDAAPAQDQASTDEDETPADEDESSTDDSVAGDEDDSDEGSEDPEPDDFPHHECEAAFRSTISDRPRTGPTPAGGQQ